VDRQAAMAEHSKHSDPWSADTARDEFCHRPDQRIETVGRSARRKSAHAEIAQFIMQVDLCEETTGCVLQAHPEKA
jgi:hypothetical protein